MVTGEHGVNRGFARRHLVCRARLGHCAFCLSSGSVKLLQPMWAFGYNCCPSVGCCPSSSSVSQKDHLRSPFSPSNSCASSGHLKGKTKHVDFEIMFPSLYGLLEALLWLRHAGGYSFMICILCANLFWAEHFTPTDNFPFTPFVYLFWIFGNFILLFALYPLGCKLLPTFFFLMGCG